MLYAFPDSRRLTIFFNYYFLFNLGRSFSVQHCSPMIPMVGCTNSQVLPWSELTVRSLSSTAPAPQVRCSNRTSNTGNKKCWALPGIKPGTLRTRVKDLHHRTTTLLNLFGRCHGILNFLVFHVVWCFNFNIMCLLSSLSAAYHTVKYLYSAPPRKNAVTAFQISSKLLSFTFENSWRN